MDNDTLKQPVSDPWRHRSDGMRCKTCMWFARKGLVPANVPMIDLEGKQVGVTADPRGHIGRCRRHAPTMNGYPVVFEIDWCGDHKLDESKTLC